MRIAKHNPAVLDRARLLGVLRGTYTLKTPVKIIAHSFRADRLARPEAAVQRRANADGPGSCTRANLNNKVRYLRKQSITIDASTPSHQNGYSKRLIYGRHPFPSASTILLPWRANHACDLSTRGPVSVH